VEFLEIQIAAQVAVSLCSVGELVARETASPWSVQQTTIEPVVSVVRNRDARDRHSARHFDTVGARQQEDLQALLCPDWGWRSYAVHWSDCRDTAGSEVVSDRQPPLTGVRLRRP
jgi:hypothetical protein